MDCTFSSVITLNPQKDAIKTKYVRIDIDSDHELGATFYDRFRYNDLVFVVE